MGLAGGIPFRPWLGSGVGLFARPRPDSPGRRLRPFPGFLAMPEPNDIPPAHLARQLDALCDRFEEGWQAGLPPPVEELIRGAPEVARPRLLRELLAVERDYRGRAGRPLAEAEARDRFAPLGDWAAEVVADFFADDPALCLDVVEGPAAGRSFRLTGHATFTIGRLPGLHVSLPADPYLSRLHCLIEFNPPAARVVDLDSKSGTKVNGTRVARAALKTGDWVKAGATVLLVRLPSDEPPTWTGRPDGDESSDFAAEPTPRVAFPSIPGYAIEAEHGRGNMGVVYRARSRADGLVVALKVILPAVAPTPAAVGRFRREADILGKLSHPNIVGYRESGAAGGLLYFVMELVPGLNAAQIVARDGPLDPDRAARWVGQLLDALAHAHDRGFVHRDVKPSNLLVVAGPEGETVKLSDFGLARTYETSSMSGLTVVDSTGGTPAFMPPEQVNDFRGVKPSADQYAAAATLHYLVTGTHVYESCRTVPELLKKIAGQDPIPLRPGAAAIPGRVGEVIRRGLSRDPAARYPDVRAMRAALLGE
jgi:serine/threonine-protein kinase